MADRYERVLDEAGATEQEWARFTHLIRKAPLGAFMAIMAIDGGALSVAEAIDSATEIAKERGEWEARR